MKQSRHQSFLFSSVNSYLLYRISGSASIEQEEMGKQIYYRLKRLHHLYNWFSEIEKESQW